MNGSWGEIDARISRQSDNFPKMSDLVEVYDKKNFVNQYKAVRLVGPVSSSCNHSIKVRRKTPVEGKPNEYFYMQPCLNYNPKEGVFEDHDCPYCKAGVPASIKFYQNAIIRELEDNPPMNKGSRTEAESVVKEIGGFKAYIKEAKNTSAWTPVRVMEIPKSLTSDLKTIENTNMRRDPETGKRNVYPISDLQNGGDLFFSYNPNEPSPAKMYKVARDTEAGCTPVTPEMRKEYLFWDIFQVPEPDKEKVIANFKKDVDRIINASNKEFVETYMEENGIKKTDSSKPAEKKVIKTVNLDDDDEDEIQPQVHKTSTAAKVSADEVESPREVDDDLEDFEDLD